MKLPKISHRFILEEKYLEAFLMYIINYATVILSKPDEISLNLSFIKFSCDI